MAARATTSAVSWQETSTFLDSTNQSTVLESVVREHARFVFKVAFGVLRNSHDAEDVVQEVFLRVHRRGTKDVCDIRSWLASIAFRLAIDRVRKPEVPEITEMETPTQHANAERTAIHRQQVEYAQKLIAALPEELRYPLVLSAMEELNSRQIADVLRISESTVRGRIFRARQMLKERLASMTEKKS
jgi:RNA polymerase sigma-70 factor (ECF subfamily)